MTENVKITSKFKSKIASKFEINMKKPIQNIHIRQNRQKTVHGIALAKTIPVHEQGVVHVLQKFSRLGQQKVEISTLFKDVAKFDLLFTQRVEE